MVTSKSVFLQQQQTHTRLTALFQENLGKLAPEKLNHSLANRDSCLTPAKSEGIEYLQSWTEIRYSISWTIFVYL